MSDWKNYKIIDEAICLKVCYGDKVKRLDIRAIIAGYPSKFGVCLKPSEFKFVLDYYNNWDNSPSEVDFYDISISKKSNASFEIKKSEKKIITPLAFWDKVMPYVPVALNLVSDNIAVDQLVDLHCLSFFMTKEQMLQRQWAEIQHQQISFDFSPIYQLGLVSEDAFINRKIDIDSLNRFIDMNHSLFESFVKLIYK